MDNVVHDAERLKELQSLPLERKIQISQTRIIEWYQHYDGNVVVSFSGGKDSTVLLHLVRSIYPDVKAVFSNTGLEYPEIQKHVRSIENVDIVVPSMRFDEVISTYGYPLIGKEVAEAIYYARRIRSQSLKVEREREVETYKSVRERRQSELLGMRKRCTRGSGFVERDLHSETIRGGYSKSSHESPIPQTDKSSHRDKHCKKQTNGADGEDGRIKGSRGSAGVASSNWGGGVQNPDWWNYQKGEHRRFQLRGYRSGVARQREGEETSAEPG